MSITIKRRRPEAQKIAKIFDFAAKNYTYKKGADKIEKIIKLHPEFKNESTLCDLGFLYDHMAINQKNNSLKNNYERKAFGLYRQALRSNPRSINATWGIGRIWWHRKNIKAIKYAVKAAQLMKKISGSSGLMLQNIGLVYEDLSNTKQAEYWYKQGIKEEPKKWGGYYNILNLYQKQRRINEIQKLLPIMKRLYQKESIEFKKTLWGKYILKNIQELEQFVKKNKKKRKLD